MKKYFLILTMMLTAVSGAWADASGSCGDGVTWSYVEPTKTLTISYTGSGSGAMANYDGDQPWKDLKSQITTVTIESGVTKIGNNAFNGYTNLASVSIPTTVTSIGNDAFAGCTSLTSISIPASVETIGDDAFGYCTSLATVTFEGTSTLTTIGAIAFYNCEKLESISIPNSVTTIGDYAFNGCSSLTAINVAEGNANYASEDGVLFDKTKTTIVRYPVGKIATSYTIPASVTTIYDRAFYQCTSLTSVSIPASVTSIVFQAFDGCTSLTAFNVADGNANYASEDGVLFDKTKTTIVRYPVGKIATSYTIPASVTTIYDRAFYQCTSLTSVSIPANVTAIGVAAFNGCTNLTSISIPTNVTAIGMGAFLSCTNLASVTVYAPACTLGSSAFDGCNDNLKIYVFNEKVDNYKAAANWSSYAGKITGLNGGYCGTTGHATDVMWLLTGTSPNYTLTIWGTGEMAGYDPGEQPWKAYNGGITSVVIGNGVTNIGRNICYGYTTLTYVSIPASVTSIGEQAFKGCTNLTSITIPDDVTSIGKKAFNICSSLSSINIPAGIETFDRSWFTGCNSLTAINVDDNNQNYSSADGVLFNKDKTTLIQYPAGKEAATYTIPSTVTSIGNEAFSWSTKLTSVIIPTGVTTIGDYAFSMSEKLASVTFAAGSSLTSISDNAFFYCTNLTSITIPAGVTSIGARAFYGCSKLPSITLPASVTSIGDDAFYYCTNLASINIPAGVTSIGADLFSGCSKLASVTIPASVTTIGDGAFRNCALTSIEIPASVTSIGMGAFLQCGNLGAITMNSSPLIGDDAFEYIKEGAVVAINAPAHDADSYQWATFYNENYAFQADENTQVFKVALDGTTVELLEVTDKIVNAGTPVVLKSTGTPVMTLTTAGSSDTQSNDLKGTSTTITNPNPGNAYVLNNGDNGVGFYKLASTGTIEFGKAYLVATAGAREFLTFGETTDISEKIKDKSEKSGEGSDVIYDIHGRRVNGKPSKGLYIINGKKVVMK